MAKQKKKRPLFVTLAMIFILFFLLTAVSCGAIWYYGTTLPEGHTASGSAIINAEVEEVFGLQADVRKAPEWNGTVAEIRDYKESEDGTASWTEIWADGNEFAMKRTAYVEDKLIRVEIEDKAEVFNGSWTFEFEEVEGGTRVTITEQGNIPNSFVRGMFNLVTEPDATLKEHLARLKRETEERVKE
jgi:hypothetical protein